MRLRLVALEAVILTLISFLVLSMTAAGDHAPPVVCECLGVDTEHFPTEGSEHRDREYSNRERGERDAGRWNTAARSGARTVVCCCARLATGDLHECAQQVVGVRGAIHKSFPTREQAEVFIRQKRLR